MFLRRHMNSQGFVPLTVLTNFNRIKQLTPDIDLIRYVCRQSLVIDIQTAADGVDHIRKMEDWQQWVLTVEERDPSAQNDGPIFPPLSLYQQYGSPDGIHSPSTMPIFNNISPRHSAGPIPFQMDAMLPQASTNEPIRTSVVDDISNGMLNGSTIPQTPLSAAVPDFTPHRTGSQHQQMSQLEPSLIGENGFTDEQVESLMIVIRKPVTPSTSRSDATASRVFSNGVPVEDRDFQKASTEQDLDNASPQTRQAGDGRE